MKQASRLSFIAYRPLSRRSHFCRLTPPLLLLQPRFYLDAKLDFDVGKIANDYAWPS